MSKTADALYDAAEQLAKDFGPLPSNWTLWPDGWAGDGEVQPEYMLWHVCQLAILRCTDDDPEPGWVGPLAVLRFLLDECDADISLDEHGTQYVFYIPQTL